MKPYIQVNAVKSVDERCRSIVMGKLEEQELTLEDWCGHSKISPVLATTGIYRDLRRKSSAW